MSSDQATPTAATVTLCSRAQALTGAGWTPGQLMVIEPGSSFLFELPTSGTVLIGRGPDAQLRLQAALISRHHARLELSGADVTVFDLGSRNGTRVNGERIGLSRKLVTGDIITLCDVALIYTQPAGTKISRLIHETADVLRARLAEEVEQAFHTHRSGALLCVRCGPMDAAQRQQLADLASPHLHLSDVLAWHRSGEELLLLRPDCDEHEAQALATQLLGSLRATLPAVRAGYACCPADGYSVEGLVEGACTAAERAAAGEPLAAPAAVSTIRIGERSVLVADPAMIRLYALINRLAQSDLPVLVTGETGAGKEIAAQALHSGSRRAGHRLVSINCAALAESLAESELFGHEKGAFSGASAAKVGLLESAHGGTVFFDEVGELPLAMQAKLLRALEEKRIMRVGDTKERPIDVRFIAATNRKLLEEVSKGKFRQDLYFRLTSAVLTLPPLRERQRELPLLARLFLAEACQRAGRPLLLLAPATLDVMLRYGWPGNVRELRNAMDYAATVVSEPVVEPEHLPESLRPTAPPPTAPATEALDGSVARLARNLLRLPVTNKLEAIEAALVTEAMRMTEGNKSAAARLLGVHRRIVERRLDKHAGDS